jgi:hypothetical protein
MTKLASELIDVLTAWSVRYPPSLEFHLSPRVFISIRTVALNHSLG